MAARIGGRQLHRASANRADDRTILESRNRRVFPVALKETHVFQTTKRAVQGAVTR